MKDMKIFINSIFRRLILNENKIIELASFSNKKILDVGCGYGYFSQLIAKTFPNSFVTGIDKDQSKIKNAKNNFKLPNLKFLIVDACEFHLKNYFDIIMAIDLLHHIPSDDHFKVMDVIKSNLKDNGVFINVDLNKNSFLVCFNTLHDIIINRFNPNYRSVNEWEKLGNMIGFKMNKFFYSTRLVYPHIYMVFQKS